MNKFFKTIAVCLAGMVILVIAQLIGVGIGELMPELIGGIIASVLYPVLAYLGIKLFCKKLLKTELSEMGIKKFRMNPVWIILAVGLPLVVDTALILTGGEWHTLESNKLNTAVTGICLYSIAGGIVEEMVFRGLIMGIIRKNYNIKSAVIVPSVLFGVAHLANGKLDIISAVQLIIAGTAVGIMFSLIMLNENNFWNNALVHAVWNMSTIGIMHIGTKTDDLSVFSFVLDSDNRIITGGDFGIESSIISIAGYIIVSIIAFAMIKKKGNSVHETMGQLS
ncbi:MAG: CPBP family intramembrane metalloprotease [Ruminococcus flavefaciens]|nr:CPBP family intramembrane metalloprotease [Ruminococcus flavefaciens]